jgi:hypothetical protein
LHPNPDPASGYFSNDKYLCDVRLVTGTPKDTNLNKILRGDSVKVQEAASGSLSQWETQIKSKEIWDLTYDDKIWMDDEDQDG